MSGTVPLFVWAVTEDTGCRSNFCHRPAAAVRAETLSKQPPVCPDARGKISSRVIMTAVGANVCELTFFLRSSLSFSLCHSLTRLAAC